MPIATNPETGEAVYLSEQGQWTPAQTAVNPETGQRLAFDGSTWVKIKPAPQKESLAERYRDSTFGALTEAGGNLATAGLGDEIFSGVDAAAHAVGRLATTGDFGEAADRFGERYGETQRKHDAYTRALQDEHPVATGVGGAVGALAGGPGKLGYQAAQLVGKVPTALARVPLAGALAGAEGAALGAATAEQGERGQGAFYGGLIGAPLGALGQGAGEMVGAGVRRLAQKAARRGGLPRGKVQSAVMDVIDDQGLTPRRVARRLQNMPEDAVIADTSPGLRGLAEDAVNSNLGARAWAERVLRPRQERMIGRVLNTARAATGANKGSFASARDIAAAKRQAAERLLPLARAQNFKVTDDVASLLSRPAIRDAYSGAQRLAANDGVSLPNLFVRQGDDLVVNRNLSNADLFDAFDYMRKMLNQQSSAAFDGGKMAAMANAGNSAQLADIVSVSSLARQWRDALKVQNPSYANYLSQYADEFANTRAMQLGETLWRTQGRKGLIDQVDDLIADMSDSEVAYLKEGIMQSVRDSLETRTMTGNAAKVIFRSPRMQQIMRRAVTAGARNPSAEWSEFNKAMGDYIEMSATYNQVLGGSPTARRLAGSEALDAAGSAAESTARGDFTGALLSGLRSLLRAGRMSPADRQQAARLLLTPRRGVNLTELNNLMVRYRATNEVAPAVASGLSTAGQGALIPQAAR